MKISVDDVELFEINPTQQKVIEFDIDKMLFYEDMQRRLKWVLMHKYEMCLEVLLNEWLPIIKTRYQSIPTDQDELLQLIFSQPDYRDRLKKNDDHAMKDLREKWNVILSQKGIDVFSMTDTDFLIFIRSQPDYENYKWHQEFINRKLNLT